MLPATELRSRKRGSYGMKRMLLTAAIVGAFAAPAFAQTRR